jgi:hypothetical protein
MTEPTPPTYVNTGTGSGLLCLVGVFLIVALALLLFLRQRSKGKSGGVQRSKPDPTDPYGTITTEKLAADANSLLVEADDSLKTSEQELTFATAQYGTEATAEFTEALELSRTDVAAAFHLRQQLDDDVPDTEATKRTWYVEIIDRCRAADARLDAQVEAFDKLRDLEANVETLIPQLSTRRDAAFAKLEPTTATYESIKSRYAQNAVQAVSNSAAQIQERIDFADRTLRQATQALEANNRPLAALAVRAVEEALGQVDMIHDGVWQLATSLDAAMASVHAMLNEVDTDIAAGQAAVTASTGTSTPATVDLAAAVAAAQQVLTTVRAEIDPSTALPDPFDELRRLEQVNVRIDAALASIRDAADRAARARTMLEQAIPAARAEISAVTNFITTRRGAIGSDARTRLSEAERYLEQAVAQAEVDPVAALSAAQQADALAEQAGKLANEDVSGWHQPQFGGGGGGGISMGGLGGAVLGGILLEGVLGGGRGRGGGFGGLGGTAFGWGGRMPGSFGGPGTRVRFRI